MTLKEEKQKYLDRINKEVQRLQKEMLKRKREYDAAYSRYVKADGDYRNAAAAFEEARNLYNRTAEGK